MTSTSAEPEYLQPLFDPASLTIPKLRNLLHKHEIDYPSDAKKPQLINIFNKGIAPRAAALLDAHKNVRPSADGIVDASPQPRRAKRGTKRSHKKSTIQPPAQDDVRHTDRDASAAVAANQVPPIPTVDNDAHAVQ